jgi:hypothetical protein
MDTFAARLDGAQAWLDAAVEDSQEGDWARNALERRVMAHVRAAANPLHGGRLAPFTEDSWHVRIGRISNWAGLSRLAALAGGWEIRPVVGRRPPRPAGMAELLSGLHAIGEQGELWMARLREGRVPPERGIARAEALLTGPGSVEDLELFFYDG